eukprot:CAMPEP_0206823724 /NCGR_PEP_ID=MMETSP0975-20121206/13469_1 /ASSEMBLY_ACC=CAM_ASM_000399 /TAXON_ID=483370 /ORGANISM="non described non described, Strain CCMP2097" /LENGTH=47 /DNA_ID= /DNA_START= /DNA_END= /DNA_ORIENTATION=
MVRTSKISVVFKHLEPTLPPATITRCSSSATVAHPLCGVAMAGPGAK